MARLQTASNHCKQILLAVPRWQTEQPVLVLLDPAARLCKPGERHLLRLVRQIADQRDAFVVVYDIDGNHVIPIDPGDARPVRPRFAQMVFGGLCA
ncbi:MAG TPA: hypothetical protein VN541_17320, partial [Tepidisphaeraceae bacterium]|nr:hypothetical protein [Tepidisphaeraceae bacterium]